MIELAFVLPIALVVILCGLNAEWAVFQVQELRDAANTAVHAAIVSTPGDLAPGPLGTICNDTALAEIRQAAGIIPISSSSSLCIPPGHSNVLYLNDGNLTICITSDPTVYAPSHVTAVVSDQLATLGPIPLFGVAVTETSESTTGNTGVPGTVGATPDHLCT